MNYVTGSLIGASLTPEYQELGKGTKRLLAEVGTAYGEQAQAARSVAAEAFLRANQRYKASQEWRDGVMMLTQMNKQIMLLKISKADGQIMRILDMGKEREPRYEVDPITDQIYVLSSESTLRSYRF